MTNNPKALARSAGVLYLLLAVLGILAQVGGRGGILVADDAAATAANIAAHATTFRLSIVADILMAVVFVVLGLTMQRLLHHVHERAAAALTVFVSVGAGFILLNLVFQVGALLAATSPAYADGGDTLALLLLRIHADGYVMGGVFFGLWLLPAGFLAYRSGMFPRWLGVALMVACPAWLADPLLAFGLPDAPEALRTVVSLPTSIGEFGLMLYLLIRGVRTVRPDRPLDAARLDGVAAA